MAKFTNCVNKAFKAGKISKEVKEALLENPDNPNQVMAEVLKDLSKRKRNTALEALTGQALHADIQSHTKGLATGLNAAMARDVTGLARYENVDLMTKGVKGEFHGTQAKFLSRFRTRMFGFSQDKEGLDELVDAFYGLPVKDKEIGAFAKELSGLFDEMMARFNKAGGNISKNIRWLLPQSHNFKAVGRATQDEWKAFVRPKLDRDMMVDDFGVKLTNEQLEKGLDAVYKAIVTRGHSKIKPIDVPRMGRALSQRHAERRFLYFKTSEDWRGYNDKFGTGNTFHSITEHIDTLAHEIALMERFGPNPQNNFDAMLAQVKAEIKAEPRIKREAKIAMAKSLWSVTSGQLNKTDSVTLADLGQATRNVLTAAKLGSATLSAVGDVFFQGITSVYRNINPVKVYSRTISLLNPANESDRVFAVELGLIADSWTDAFQSANRFGDIYGQGRTAKMAEVVIRASGLNAWTEANRKAFGMEYTALIAKNFSQPFEKLNKNFRRGLEEYNISKSDWDAFRKSKPLERKGARFADFTQEGGEKFHMMVLGETDFAVPTPDARVRAMTTGGMDRGTGGGELWRSGMMFKSFPLTIIGTHLYRAAFQQSMNGKIAYFGSLAIGSMVFGGMSLQLKDISKGLEPRPMDDKFLIAAMAQGGGWGIFGDFLFSDQNRFGHGIETTLGGPPAELLGDIIKLTFGNIQEAVAGEETNIIGESIDLARSLTPSIWQSRLIQDQITDQLRIMADPSAYSRFKRKINKRQKDYTQDYWWKPGSGLPEFAK